MNPIDPLRPSSLDDIVGPAKSGPAYGGYGAASPYRPYRWEMRWINTPQPEGPSPYEPPPEPPRLPSYDDGRLTPDLFAKLLDDLKD